MRRSEAATAETAGGRAYMQAVARARNGPARRRPEGEPMIQTTRLAAAFAFGAALTAAGVALAQTQTGSTAPPAASAQPAPPPAHSAPTPTQSSPPWAQSETPTIKPSDPNTSQPTYSVDPPPDGSSGVYLPAAILGYAKSAAGCVVIGCDDGPQVGGAPGPSSSGPAEPPPANPGPPDPH
jgi:hypothetical protein